MKRLKKICALDSLRIVAERVCVKQGPSHLMEVMSSTKKKAIREARLEKIEKILEQHERSMLKFLCYGDAGFHNTYVCKMATMMREL